MIVLEKICQAGDGAGRQKARKKALEREKV